MVSFKCLLKKLEKYRLQYNQKISTLVNIVLLGLLIPRTYSAQRANATCPNDFFNEYLILNLEKMYHNINCLEDWRGNIQLFLYFLIIATCHLLRLDWPQKVLTHRKKESLRQQAVSLDIQQLKILFNF